LTSQNPPSPAVVYNDFFGPPMFTPWAKDLVGQASLSAGNRVLDLACGTGLVSEQIAPMIGSTGSIAGLDFNPVMLEVARKRELNGPAVEWVEASALDIPYDDDSFDVVVCQQGFQFFPDKEKAAAETRRVLKPGGTVAASVWATVDELPVWEVVFTSVATRLDVPMESVTVPNSFGYQDKLEALFTDAGFSNAQVNKRSTEAAFGPADSFVKLMVMGAAAAIPAFGALSDEEKQALVPGVEADTAEIIQQYTRGDKVVMELNAYTATATS